MLLIVILNALLAIGIVGVIVALHAKAIVDDHLQNGAQPSTPWTVGERTVRPAERTPEYWPARRPAASRPVTRRQVAAARH